MKRLLRRLLYRPLRWLFPGLVGVNYPDLPDVASGEWLVLERGHFGVLAATRVGFGRVLLGVFKGYDQKAPGVLLTSEKIRQLHYFAEHRS